MLCFFDILKYMKSKFLILGALGAVALTGCKYNFEVKSDFTFKDDNVVIKDTLQQVENKTAHIALLYGQSNADGVSLTDYLKANDLAKYEEYAAGYDNVLINFYNDNGQNSSNYEFMISKLGMGCTTYTFGPELGIAEKMSKAYPGEISFIIKWTVGGTFLKDQWLDGKKNRGDLYNRSMDFTIKCLNYLKSKGYSLSFDGICWMQGESDACKNLNWESYYKDTVAYVAYLRHDLQSFANDIKFIDAAINNEPGVWPFHKNVNKAKRKFAELSESNIYIDTTALGLTSKNEPTEKPDRAHYDSTSMVKLGQAFGDALIGE